MLETGYSGSGAGPLLTLGGADLCDKKRPYQLHFTVFKFAGADSEKFDYK
jgi:hypothetical protein